jgi:hypothetical protein
MKNIAAAFIRAKRAFGTVLKGKTNPAFKSKYANLEACLEAVDDACLTNGIALYQETSEDPTGVTVETVFLHESGESLRCGKLHVPASKQDPQGYGSALTYARRYSLLAACGIAAEDDDGNAASKAPAIPQGMSPGNIADWIAFITEAGDIEDLRARTSEAQTAAKEVGDKTAYAAFQGAGKKRAEELKVAA